MSGPGRTAAVSPRQALSRLLRRVALRTRVAGALRGAAAGVAAAVAALLVILLPGSGGVASLQAAAGACVAGAAGALAGWWRARRTSAALLVERHTPRSRNLILTAAELLPAGSPSAVRPARDIVMDDGGTRPGRADTVREIILEAAGTLAGTVNAAAVQPLSGPALLLALTSALCFAVMVWAASAPVTLRELVTGAPAAPGIIGVDVVVLPPAWIGGEPVRTEDAGQLQALAGSTLRLTVRATAASVYLERVGGGMELAPRGNRTFTADVRIDGDDFLALEPRDSAGVAGARRLLGVRALADAPPRVRIAAPARDLVLPHADSVLQLEVEAEDDHALASLALRYTRVTGFGEQFTFLEGEVPLAVTRVSPTRWTARARWPLQALALERGDIVVYRAVATDRQPAAGEAESETYIVEIGDANVAAAGGFPADEDPDRYALSQQMVIVLTERLMARRAQLTPAAFAAEAGVLAAAQRRVRAEFVFMLGGELGDEHDHEEQDMAQLHEEAHARADLDVLEGRIASQGRQELVRAIQAMSYAARYLDDVEMADALRAEQTALVFLQRAFSRSRYILRALTEREAIDLSRRLTGSLVAATSQRRPQRDEALDSTVLALRRVLAEAAALAGSGADRHAAARRASDLARDVVAIAGRGGDVDDEAVHEAAARFADAAVMWSAGDARGGETAVGDGVLFVARALQRRTRPAPHTTPAALRALEGELVDALRGSR